MPILPVPAIRLRVLRAGVCALAAAALCGCEVPPRSGGVNVAQAWEARQTRAEEPATDGGSASPDGSEPASAGSGSAPSSADGPPVATVNGTPIDRRKLIDLLLEGQGAAAAELLMRLELARAATRAAGLSVSQGDIDNEYAIALRALVTPVGDDDEASFNRREAERLLDDMLPRRGISRRQFMLKVEHDAHVRKLAAAQVQVSEEQVAAEQERAYGERVQVRHIQCSSLDEVSTVRRRLKAGDDFELLARKYSRNNLTAPAGGLLPPFSRHDDDVPALLRAAAFDLKAGQLSENIYEDGVYQIIRCERRIPGRAGGGLFADKNALRERVRRRLEDEKMQQIAADLFDKARIDVADPRIAAQLRQKYPNKRIGGK